MGRGAGITCPHCDSRALLRRTKAISELTREKTYRCNNDNCGHVFVSVEEIQRTVVRPRQPRDGVNLPMSKMVIARLSSET
ncbi:ogr/Delta-like zinc finger family protein [Shewanella baltica]|uniref:ogr/Delta-like zinc finger family protein n=1 Tax=Shewanella TaxID=22 RepID=UPI000DE80975|nr:MULTISPECIES: ogr/Delta-like zinc finger family protein [Shewanella]MCS6134011.1 ogr/Delta-like zinc finger family protein [Shewanella baltica]MCU8087663.1 ogr/Delta-like zinc finger family protein [Shewanella sp. SM21]RBP73456.1 Ogr/Delta-like zinc finger protein [Shewanella putrefaciens]